MSEINPQNTFDDFRTPRDLFCSFDERFHFDIDVAASDENKLCENYYTEEDDGLSHQWYGNVWCNPPYSNVKVWLHKALNELSSGRCQTVVFLLNVDTSTQYFHDIILASAQEIHLIRGRVNFEGPHVGDGANPKASMMVVFTNNLNPEKQYLNTIYTDGTNTGRQTKLNFGIVETFTSN